MRGWKNDSKESVRLKAEARRERELAEELALEQARAREAGLQAKLAEKSKGLAERLVAIDIEDAEKHNPSLHKLLTAVVEKAPRLLTVGTALKNVAKLPFLREPSTWEPRGKGRETLFRSLCDHLFASFPMPAFLWSAFFEDDADEFALFVAHVAMGGSVFGGVRSGLLPIPLTRQMCHDLMQTSADVGFFKGLRRVEVRTYGGGPRFFTAWMGSQAGRRLHSAEDEAFWITVIEWFGKNPMADPNQVGPLVDYIIYRRRQDGTFTMKGRSVLAMMRGTQEWHGQLAKEKAVHGTAFKPTGFKEYEVCKGVRTQEGAYIEEVWRVEELLSSKALAEEGRALSHCVYSYAGSIEKGHTSIWSLNVQGPGTKGKQKMMTVELRNDIKRVVQFRGKFNRQSSAREFQILTNWANLNGLEVGLGRW